MTCWCSPQFCFHHLKLTNIILDVSCEEKYTAEQVPETSGYPSSLGPKGLFTHPQQPQALKLWDTGITAPLVEHCPVQILTKRLHGCERQGAGEWQVVQLDSPRDSLSYCSWDSNPLGSRFMLCVSEAKLSRSYWHLRRMSIAVSPQSTSLLIAFDSALCLVGGDLKAGESCACCCQWVCCSYQLGFLSNWAVFDFMSCQICFFPFRSLRKSQVMFKPFRGTLSTTALVWPIKLLTAVGMRTGKIFTLPKSWKRSTSSFASDFPQCLDVPQGHTSREHEPHKFVARRISLTYKDTYENSLPAKSEHSVPCKSAPAMNDSHSTKICRTALMMGVGYVLALSMGRCFTPKPCKDSNLVVLCGERGRRVNRIRDSPPLLFEKLNHFS